MKVPLPQAVRVTAPTRIDLAGGTVDIWPLYLFHAGAVTVNVAIDLRVMVRIVRTRDSQVRLTDLDRNRSLVLGSPKEGGERQGYPLFRLVLGHFGFFRNLKIDFSSGGVPPGSGLAGSSALMAALCAALLRLKGERRSRERFLRLIRDLETRLIRVPAGMQDYYPALWGGVQALWWNAGGVLRETLRVSRAELEKRLLLVYTGKSRHSGVNNWEVFKRHLDGNKGVQRVFSRIVAASREMAASLGRGDFAAAGHAMAEEYAARKRLFPGIATPEIETLESLVRRQGALAFKVCGAGGGGCAVVYAGSGRQEPLRREIERRGWRTLSFKISPAGMHAC